MKTVADTLGVARSNIVEQLRASKPRGRYHRQGDEELLAAIRQITDARPTYGYRRVTALLNRARRTAGDLPVNHKRIFRLMAAAQLLLQPHVGHRPVRAREGSVIAPASNRRARGQRHRPGVQSALVLRRAGDRLPEWRGRAPRLRHRYP